MDIFPAELIRIATFLFKSLFLLIGVFVFAVNYFQAREASKIESKLSVSLPGSVHAAMSFQLLLSLLFVIAMSLFLIWP